MRLIFDLDDTLLPDNYFLYEEARLRWARWVNQHLGINLKASDLFERSEEINHQLVRVKGFGDDRFVESLWLMFVEICRDLGQKPQAKEKEEIHKIGFSIFNRKHYQRLGLVEGASETLDFLTAKEVELSLLTKGSNKIQLRKIEALGLKAGQGGWFEDQDIFIVNQKTKEAMRRACQGRKKKDCWHIGNSLDSDMRPALEYGIGGILIPVTTWAYESTKDQKSQHLLEEVVILERISQIIGIYPDFRRHIGKRQR